MELFELLNKLRCQCCGRGRTDPRMVSGILHIFAKLGHDLPINSGGRCEKHNFEVGGARNSYHKIDEEQNIVNRAVDLGTKDPDEQEIVAEEARKLGFGGIGWGDKFIHLDLGPVREWRYGPNGQPIYKSAKGA